MWYAHILSVKESKRQLWKNLPRRVVLSFMHPTAWYCTEMSTATLYEQDIFLWLPTRFRKWICYKVLLFNGVPVCQGHLYIFCTIHFLFATIQNGSARSPLFTRLKIALSSLALSLQQTEGIQKPFVIIICQCKAFTKDFVEEIAKQRADIIAMLWAHFWSPQTVSKQNVVTQGFCWPHSKSYFLMYVSLFVQSGIRYQKSYLIWETNSLRLLLRHQAQRKYRQVKIIM